MDASSNPAESGDGGSPQRISLKARLMQRLSVAVGKKKRHDANNGAGSRSPRSTQPSLNNVIKSSQSPRPSGIPEGETADKSSNNNNTTSLSEEAATANAIPEQPPQDQQEEKEQHETNVVDSPSNSIPQDVAAPLRQNTEAASNEAGSQPPNQTTEGRKSNLSFATQPMSAPKSSAPKTNPQPNLPPNKPKPRGSMLGRMRRASRGALDMLTPTRDAPSNPDADDDSRDVHPKAAGGLNAFRKVLSGRRMNFETPSKKETFTTGAASSSGQSSASAGIQSGTVRSLIEQKNSVNNSSASKIPKPEDKSKPSTTATASRGVKFDDSATKAATGSGAGKAAASGKEEKGITGGIMGRASTGAVAISKPPKSETESRPKSMAVNKSPAMTKTADEASGEKKKTTSNASSRSASVGNRMSKRSMDGDGKHSRKSLGKYRSTAGVDGLELSLHEQAFMPGDLLKRLGASAGQLPPAPSVFSGQGAVLFVDVSGFTKLAERLNKDNVPVKASEKLANTITRVLEVLAQVCLDGGGEVGKFAGDALLCVWESNDLNKAELLAKHCAVQMLIEMENLNRIEKVELQIHGGVAKGSIVHFHFGSGDDDLRWYLISGEAVAAATTLVDVANAGEFCCQDGIAKGLPSIMDDTDVSPRPDGRKGFKISKDIDSGNMFSSFRGLIGVKGLASAAASNNPSSASSQSAAQSSGDAPRHTKSLARGKKELPTTFLTSSSSLGSRPDIPPEHSNISAVLKDGLPRSCNVYIPSSLRDQLNERSEKKGEMRRRIAAMFVEISSLVMTEDELLKQTVSDAKLDSLNSAFVTMTRIVHAFEGEVRDMLFDDKGCVYIAIFGAHCEEEKEHHPWNLLAVKAGMAIVNEVPSARVGVSIGTCFVGMAGVIERRTDFVVVGHEVNMAARYMANAQPGQVLVSSGIYGSTKEQIKYGPEIHIMVGKGEYAKQRTVYSPMEESMRRASFQASYRRSMGGNGLFVGRTQEIEMIEANMNKITNGRSGVMVIEAPPGRGKSSIVTRAKKMGRGKIKVISGQALSNERNSSYYAFRQVLEAYTGIRPAMTSQECKAVIERLEGGKGEKVNTIALAQVLPWINDSSTNSAAAAKSATNGGGGDKSPSQQPNNSKIAPDRVADCFLQIIKMTIDKSNEKSALIVLEDVQWMDKESLEMLIRLIEGLEKVQKVAILMTFRTELPDEGPNAAAFQAMELAAYPDDADAAKLEAERKELIANLKSKAKKLKFNSVWIELQPLPKPEATKLATKLLGGEPNEITSQKLWDQAKGDPFYLELLVQWCAERNMIRPEKSGTVSIVCDPSAFPKTSEELIHARCSLLSEEHKRILQLAASGGEVFDAVYISAVSKALATQESKPSDALSTDQVLAGLHAAADIELLTHITDSALRDEAQHKWKFKHDLIYRAVWLQISAPRRNALDRAAKTDRKKLALRLKSGFFALNE